MGMMKSEMEMEALDADIRSLLEDTPNDVSDDTEAELNALFEDIDKTNEMETMSNEVVMTYVHNAITKNLKELHAVYVILTNTRCSILNIVWDLKSPKEPTEITVEFLTDVKDFSGRKNGSLQDFREKVATPDFGQKDVDMGLIKLRGTALLHGIHGVGNVLTSTIGRNASAVISFLDGNDDYASVDLTYDNAWGSW